jgi:hypothetical protein
MAFLPDYLMTGNTSWSSMLRLVWQRYFGNYGTGAVDMGDFQTATLIHHLANPSTTTLQTVPITSFTDNGGGSYTIGWTTPAGTTALRGKHGTQTIVDWIGFDNQTNAWIGDPVTTQNWWASTEVAAMPSPVAGTQSKTITGLDTGLTADNFMVKAMAPAAVGSGGTRSAGKVTIGGKVNQ